MKGLKAIAQYVGIRGLRILINALNVFPVKNNRVMFYSFNGKQYSCNPKRISDELLKTDDYVIYWAFKNPMKFQRSLPAAVTPVKYRSLKYYYLAKTSKVLVFNVQGYGELARRKGQTFIQTWHASNGYKKVGNFTGIARKVNLLGHRDYSYVMSGAESMTQRRIRGSMGFKGEVLAGTPRMDELINAGSDEIVKRVQTALRIPAGSKLLLYAPTWRSNRSSDEYLLDYARLYDALKQRLGGEWTIAIRLHPNIKERINIDLPYVVDATDYPEMQDLLYTADMLISDYSSCIWDYSFTYRPCLLYCYDLDEYYSEKSFDIPIEKVEIPYCEGYGRIAL